MKDVEYSTKELKDFQSALKGTEAGRLMHRVLREVADGYELELHDPLAGIERMRFCQGGIDALGKVVDVVSRLLDLSVEEHAPTEDVGDQYDEPDVVGNLVF
jgi:hypothetical protein